jgi:hypothetical protein
MRQPSGEQLAMLFGKAPGHAHENELHPVAAQARPLATKPKRAQPVVASASGESSAASAPPSRELPVPPPVPMPVPPAPPL